MITDNYLLPKQAVLGCQITTAATAQVIEQVFALAQARRGAYVAFCNVHMLMEADADPAFAQVVNGAAIACPDGAPVAIYLRRRYGLATQERQPGMDLLPALLAEAERRGKRVFFLGSTEAVHEAIRQKIAATLPRLQVAGMVSPPFRTLTQAEEAALIGQIRAADPDLLFVALGCPRQERWMAAHASQIGACMLGVGQAFLTLAGLERRLPPALRGLPVEWLYRLALEPRRLFRRYLITNTRFLWRVATEKIK